MDVLSPGVGMIRRETMQGGMQDDEHTVRGAEEGTRRRLPNFRNFRAEAVDVEDPLVNVPDARGEMVSVCDYTD